MKQLVLNKSLLNFSIGEKTTIIRMEPYVRNSFGLIRKNHVKKVNRKSDIKELRKLASIDLILNIDGVIEVGAASSGYIREKIACISIYLDRTKSIIIECYEPHDRVTIFSKPYPADTLFNNAAFVLNIPKEFSRIYYNIMAPPNILKNGVYNMRFNFHDNGLGIKIYFIKKNVCDDVYPTSPVKSGLIYNNNNCLTYIESKMLRNHIEEVANG